MARKILLSNGVRSRAVPVLAYSRTDLRVPPVPARRATALLGKITEAWVGGALARVSPRPDGALAVELV
jgi:hypothetical protein